MLFYRFAGRGSNGAVDELGETIGAGLEVGHPAACDEAFRFALT